MAQSRGNREVDCTWLPAQALEQKTTGKKPVVRKIKTNACNRVHEFIL